MNISICTYRHLQIFIAFALFGIIMSCRKDIPAQTLVDTPGLKTYKALVSVANIEARQVAYGLLTSQERFDFWQTKLLKDINSGRYQEFQVLKIREFREALKADYFSNKDTKAIFKAVFIPKWIESCKNILSTAEIYDLIFNINYEKSTSHTRNPEDQASLSGNQSSDKVAPVFCKCAVGSGWTCFMMYFGNPHWGECLTSGKCVQATTGCGALNDDECDGDKCIWGDN